MKIQKLILGKKEREIEKKGGREGEREREKEGKKLLNVVMP